MTKKLLSFLLIFSTLFIFISCGEEPKTVCTEHVDNDRNKICEFCGADCLLPCTEHFDKDNDSRCDYCSAEMESAEEEDEETDYRDNIIVEDDVVITLPFAPF